jgi:hypothetical protein
MASVVLRVRLLNGDRLDVTYESASAADPAHALEEAIATLRTDSGMIRATHGDRLVVLFARGVAAIEAEPLGAVL